MGPEGINKIFNENCDGSFHGNFDGTFYENFDGNFDGCRTHRLIFKRRKKHSRAKIKQNIFDSIWICNKNHSYKICLTDPMYLGLLDLSGSWNC